MTLLPFRILVLFLGVGFAASALNAAPPISLAEVISVADLEAEARSGITAIRTILETEESYNEQKDKLKLLSSLLTIIGQALTDHPESAPLKAAGPALRDASRAIARSKDFATARASLPSLLEAGEGKAKSDAVADYSWAKLASMHATMTELENRTATLKRVLKKSRNPETDARLASVMGLIGLTIIADTHEVKNPEDRPVWDKLAQEFYTEMTKTAQSIRSKDLNAAAERFTAAQQACSACHDKFQK